MCQSHAKDKTAGAQIKPFDSAFTQVHFAESRSALQWPKVLIPVLGLPVLLSLCEILFLSIYYPLLTITQTSFVGVRVSRWSRSVKPENQSRSTYLRRCYLGLASPEPL